MNEKDSYVQLMADRLKRRLVQRVPKLRLIKNQLRTIDQLYGFGHTVRLERPVDANLDPLPWYTYPAIEFLSQFDFSSSTFIEFGGGMSTLYWSKRAKKVYTVEHDPAFYAEIKKGIPSNCELHLCEDKSGYVNFPIKHGLTPDVVVIDGYIDSRFSCVNSVLKLPKRPPIIIFDNTNWFPKSIGKLRESGYFEIDFNGFGPINSTTWTTSVFVTADAMNLQKNFRNPNPIGGSEYLVNEAL